MNNPTYPTYPTYTSPYSPPDNSFEEFQHFILMIPKNKEKLCNFWIRCKRRHCKKKRKIASRYCVFHSDKIIPEWKQDKPSDCPVCYEKIEEEKDPLECGHWVCLNCMYNSRENRCPICRVNLINVRIKETIAHIFEVSSPVIETYFNPEDILGNDTLVLNFN